MRNIASCNLEISIAFLKFVIIFPRWRKHILMNECDNKIIDWFGLEDALIPIPRLCKGTYFTRQGFFDPNPT